MHTHVHRLLRNAYINCLILSTGFHEQQLVNRARSEIEYN